MVVVTIVVNSGDLNKQIIIQKRTKTQNTFNEEINTYTTHLTCWAKIKQTVSKTDNTEIYENNQLQTKTTFEIEIRYNPTIKEDMRIVYGKKTFDILNINNLNQANIKLLITVEEVV